MALFKIFKGAKNELDQVTTAKEGYAYYTTDESNLYIDIASGVANNPANRKKIIGLSQVNRQFTLTVEGWNDDSKTQIVNAPAEATDFFKAEGYTYIVSPVESSYDSYAEAAIRAKDPVEGSITFIYKEKPSTPISVNILRIEEDPYYGTK